MLLNKVGLLPAVLLLTVSLYAQTLGNAPTPLLGATDLYSAFKIQLSDSPDRSPGDEVSQTQVAVRARKLGLTGQSALAAWNGAQALLTPPIAPLSSSAVPVMLFSGSTATALNALLANSSQPYVRVTSSQITVDQPIEITRDGSALDLGAAQLVSANSQPWMLRIDSARNVTVTGGTFTTGNSAILVNKATYVVIDHTQISGLTGDGVVVTGSTHVLVTHNRISGNAGPGVMLISGTTLTAVEQNDISNNLGQSNWAAAIVVSDRDVDLASDPHSIFNATGYWVVEAPIGTNLNPPHDNLIAFNRLMTNTSSGIYVDGAVKTIVYSNSIIGNAKEGLCLDNGSTANVVASNTIQQNGNRWGQTDATLGFDFVLSRLPDGTAAAKVPGISIDNALYNVIYSNNVSHNFGGGVKMVRTGYFNVVGMNTIENDNDGANQYFHFFGIELGAALSDTPSPELDFTPSRGNIVFSNVIRGSNAAGVFLDGGSDQNQIYNNVIMDATDFAIQSNALMPNTFQNNLTNGPSSNAAGCCTGHAPRGR